MAEIDIDNRIEICIFENDDIRADATYGFRDSETGESAGQIQISFPMYGEIETPLAELRVKAKQRAKELLTEALSR